MSGGGGSFSLSNKKKNKKGRKKGGRTEDDDDYEDEDFINDELIDEMNEDEDLNLRTGPTSSHNRINEEILSDDNSTGTIRISNFPLVIKRDVKRPHSSVISIVLAENRNLSHHHHQQNTTPSSLLSLENVSYGQLQALSSVPADQDKFDGSSSSSSSSSSSYVCTPPPIIEGRGVVKRFDDNGAELVIPMHADWFSPNSVHRLERQTVPHYFSGKSADHTPEKYMECRNKIIQKYMENPEKRLTVTDCQFDASNLNEIFRFLEHWGIINYTAAAPNREPMIGSNYLEEQNGELRVPSGALKSIDSLIHFDKPKNCSRPGQIPSSSLGSGDLVSDLESRLREVLSENNCSCCFRPLRHINYQSQKEVDIVLCSDCFNGGRFVVGHSSIDFIRVDSIKDLCNSDGDSWTDEETLLLLEAVERYNNNWDEIAEHVGTKSKAQCATHFVRLPVEEDLLENIEVPNTSVSTNPSNGNLHSSSNGDSVGVENDPELRVPFATAENPVMSLVSFLAYAVGPRVAAACAHGSLEALSKEDHQLLTSNSAIQEDLIPDGRTVKMAAKVGLAAAAVKAKLFADHEEREIQRLAANVINHQLKRLELKLKQFAELEGLLARECEQVERTRQRFAVERARLSSTRFLPAGATSNPNIPGPMANNAVNERQQFVSTTPNQQTNVSGYNNQPNISQMPFMQRQPVFGYGPRLPLSAINPPPSTSFSSPTPTGMFPASAAQGNASTSNFGHHPMLRSLPGNSKNLG